MWPGKLVVCLIYEFLDFTVGKVFFLVPFHGEIIGCDLTAALFGKAGLLYGLEAIDPTEQIDGFIPTATIIALPNKPAR